MTLSFPSVEEARRALDAPLYADLAGDLNVRFEFFPPKTAEGAAKLRAAHATHYDPELVNAPPEPVVAALQALMDAAVQSMTRQAGTDMIAAFRMSNEPSLIAPQDFVRGGLTAGMISDGLRMTVQQGPDKRWWKGEALNPYPLWRP